jgi:phosphoribosylaminoimidazole-succinocarboxamide synthase
MWRNSRLWTKKDYETTYRKEMKEAMKEIPRKSQEHQVKLWRDRPMLAKEEIPNEAFEMLQNQHNIIEDDS